MKVAVLRFPGTNCEFDTQYAFEKLYPDLSGENCSAKKLACLIPDFDKAKSVRAPTRLTRSPLSNVFPCLHIITRAIRSYHHVEVVNFQLI